MGMMIVLVFVVMGFSMLYVCIVWKCVSCCFIGLEGVVVCCSLVVCWFVCSFFVLTVLVGYLLGLVSVLLCLFCCFVRLLFRLDCCFVILLIVLLDTFVYR